MSDKPINISDAVANHRAGRLDQAEFEYRALLEAHPTHPDVHQLLGVLLVQKGELKSGIDLIQKAAELNPGDPAIQSNLGTALLEAGRTDEAIARLGRALELDPAHMDATFNLANALMHAGRPGEALPLLEKAVTAAPHMAQLHNNLALCRLQLGDDAGAIAAFEVAVRLHPSFAEAHSNLGIALQRVGRLDEARQHFERALALRPTYAEAANHLGALFALSGEPEKARRHYDAALRQAPNNPEIHLNIGNLLRSEGRLEDAAAAYERALAASPGYASAHNNLGNVLAALGRPDDALREFETALAAGDDYAELRNNYGKALRLAGRLDDAEATYERALALDPDLADARVGRAEVRLSRGRLAAGWTDYMARETMAGRESAFYRAVLGGDLAGRDVRVERDQGLGDELFFLRFVPELRRRGARVTYAADPRLVAMLERAGIADAVVAATEPPTAGAIRISAGDLPHLLGAGDGEYPPSIALTPMPEASNTVRERVTALGPAPFTAVTWRAGTAGEDRMLFKQAPVADLGTALAGLDGTVLVVQRHPTDDDLDTFQGALGRRAHDLSALNEDLEAMLALMALVDRYVCVSNTNVHLRAACGQGCHVLAPAPAEFRWMAEGVRSPWFPDSRVYREIPGQGWAAALAELRRDLGYG